MHTFITILGGLCLIAIALLLFVLFVAAVHTLAEQWLAQFLSSFSLQNTLQSFYRLPTRLWEDLIWSVRTFISSRIGGPDPEYSRAYAIVAATCGKNTKPLSVIWTPDGTETFEFIGDCRDTNGQWGRSVTYNRNTGTFGDLYGRQMCGAGHTRPEST
jgi:hypothetical protein